MCFDVLLEMPSSIYIVKQVPLKSKSLSRFVWGMVSLILLENGLPFFIF